METKKIIFNDIYIANSDVKTEIPYGYFINLPMSENEDILFYFSKKFVFNDEQFTNTRKYCINENFNYLLFKKDNLYETINFITGSDLIKLFNQKYSRFEKPSIQTDWLTEKRKEIPNVKEEKIDLDELNREIAELSI